ncbi:twin-arginine translocation signal domain-containing protein [Acidobacteria bacterium AB60]|nr:twin-arginine translocation signal domain-containing protein [Acidobacteria bacterium AB60]
MGIETSKSAPSYDTTETPATNRSVSRRHFIKLAAVAGVVAHAFGEPIGTAPASAVDATQSGRTGRSQDSRLPDGTLYRSWEQPLTFSKTYYVDNSSKHADDRGPGSKTRPFQTINKAAQVLEPGERVVIASGTYRECVRPMRGGSGPDRMISYEAAPGAKVLIKGSEVLSADWLQESVSVGRFGPPAQNVPQIPAWRHLLNGALFPDAYNPFALASAPADRAWLDTKTVDMGPYFRRRGLAFADGAPLEPVELRRELANAQLPGPPIAGQAIPPTGLPARTRGGPIMQEIGGSVDNRFWVEDSGKAITIRLREGSPAEHTIEITTREQAFVPAQKGLAFIRVKGLTFQHAGNGYPIPQRGLLSTAGGHHWIIEDNTIEWANGIGLDIANGDWNEAPTPLAGTSHIIRRNTIRYCGVEGIGGMGTHDTLIEGNLVEWCGWANAERAWEAAAAKFHGAKNLLFRRNIVRHIRHANGVWLDSRNANCRICDNVFADVLTVSAAVHMEMNLEQNQIDNNVIWDVRNAEPGTPGQRGCAGSGVFINASDHLLIAQNLIGRCDNSGIFAITRPDRANSGTAQNNQIANNIFASCGTSAIVFLSQNNLADGNVFAAMPKSYLGFFQGDSKQWLELPAWRDAHGWDKNSVEQELRIDFNPATLDLKITGQQLPRVPVVHGVDCDFFGASAGTPRAPGPLANPESKADWHLDPREEVAG